VNRTRPAMKPHTMSRTLTLGATLLALSLVAAQANAADKAAGQAKHEAVCAACHGKDANTPIDPSYPKLAGQHRDYIERALLDYKSGARKNAIMAGQAQPLSKADIANLSAYYASLPGSLKSRR
jgi:cytochrome c553